MRSSAADHVNIQFLYLQLDYQSHIVWEFILQKIDYKKKLNFQGKQSYTFVCLPARLLSSYFFKIKKF